MTTDPYKKQARYYDAFVEPFNANLRHIALSMVKLPKGSDVLEIGCGTATNLKMYREQGCRIHGLDRSPAMLEKARLKLGDEADLQLGSAEKMPFQDNSIDLALAMLTLHEMPLEIRKTVISEMVRVVKPHGNLLFVDFHPGSRSFPKGWLIRALILIFELSAGWEHFNNHLTFLAHKGLLPLLEDRQLSIEKTKIVAGGNLAFYLAKV